jgi:hypothetical protein
MSRTTPRARGGAASWGLGAAAAAAMVVGAAAQEPPAALRGTWYGRDAKGSYTAYRDAGGRFSLDYPRRDWLLLTGDGAVLLVATHNRGEAWIILERVTMATSLAPDEVTDLFADLETENVRQHQPRAEGFVKRVFDTDNRRFIALQYTRPGADPRSREIVRQYSFPVGQDLYRLVCAVQGPRFDRYEAMCAHVAATFRPVPPA